MTTKHRSLLILFAFFAARAAFADGNWTDLRTGMAVFTGSYSHRAPLQQVRIVAIRMDQSLYRLRVVDLSTNQMAPTLSLLASDAKAVAAINGAYVTSYAFPRPLGFARVRGSALSRMNPGRLFSGVLCIDKNGRTSVIKTKSEPGPECVDALQSGPLIVEEPGTNGISATEPATRGFERSAVCLDDSSRVVLIRTTRTTLMDLAEFLRAAPIGCRVAINLSGDADSGLLWREKAQLRTNGSVDASLATAVVVTAR
jgi:hypothetical protein